MIFIGGRQSKYFLNDDVSHIHQIRDISKFMYRFLIINQIVFSRSTPFYTPTLRYLFCERPNLSFLYCTEYLWTQYHQHSKNIISDSYGSVPKMLFLPHTLLNSNFWIFRVCLFLRFCFWRRLHKRIYVPSALWHASNVRCVWDHIATPSNSILIALLLNLQFSTDQGNDQQSDA